jgi:hypothetical protein
MTLFEGKTRERKDVERKKGRTERIETREKSARKGNDR